MLKLQELAIAYAQKQILHPSSLDFDLGQFIALIGRNGSGKSSLLRTLSGLQQASAGEIFIQEQAFQTYNTSKLAKLISIVNTSQINFPYLSVKEIVSLGRHPHLPFGGRLRKTDLLKIEEALEVCGLTDLAQQAIAHCSDGEKQKTMLARALAQDTSIMLLDEITAHLDFVHRHQSFQLLKKLAQEKGKLIIMATHEVELALKYADQILVLHEGRLHYQKPRALKNSDLLKTIFEGIA